VILKRSPSGTGFAPSVFPIVTRLLLISWTIPQLASTFGGPAIEAWITQHFALIPAHLSGVFFASSDLWPLFTLVSSSFLHAGWFHLAANALFMAMIAPPLERALGTGLFAAVYALSVVAAGLAHWLFNSGDFVAVVGASGGISGVFAVFIVLFARRTLADKVILGQRIAGSTLHILWQLAAWLGIQALSAITFNQAGGGIAVWAHIGGFVVGLICGAVLRPRVIEKSYRS
jgi:membrane associated rhomboid family serine protease